MKTCTAPDGAIENKTEGWYDFLVKPAKPLKKSNTKNLEKLSR